MQQVKVESPNDHLMVTFQESDKDLPLDSTKANLYGRSELFNWIHPSRYLRA